MSNPNPNLTTRFAPGNTLGGRPKGARARLGEKFMQALADDFEQHGDFVISDMRQNDRATYFTTVAKLQPREVEAKLQVEQRLPGNLDPQSWASLNRVIDLIKRFAPAGADPAEIFETIERALIAAYEHAPLAIEAPALAIAPAASASPARPVQIDIEDAIAATVPKPPY